MQNLQGWLALLYSITENSKSLEQIVENIRHRIKWQIFGKSIMRAWLCDAETLEPYLSLAVNAAVGAKLKIMPILVGALQQGQMRGWKCFRFLDASMDTINPLPVKGHFKRDYHRPKTSFLLETYFRMKGLLLKAARSDSVA